MSFERNVDFKLLSELAKLEDAVESDFKQLLAAGGQKEVFYSSDDRSVAMSTKVLLLKPKKK